MDSLTQAYRDSLAAQGISDPRDDYTLLREYLGPLAQQNPAILDQYPDFAANYAAARDANAPSLLGEAGRALKGGSQELAATTLGAGALATDSDYLKQKAQSFQQDAAQNAPTIPTLEDIAPGDHSATKYLSKDTLRYLAAKAGGAVPALGEGVALAAAGAAAGSALEPGVGTAVGAGEGLAEGLLGRGALRSAIGSLLDKQGAELVAQKVIPEATESALATAAETSPELQQAISTEAKAIAGQRAGLATNVANMYAQSAGGVYNETGDPSASLELGAVGALPGIILPELVIHKLYPGVTAAVGQRLGGEYVKRLATQAVLDAGLMGGTMGIQEATNVVARNIAAGRDPTSFTDEDWRRIREAAIGGAASGPLIAPLTAMSTGEQFSARAPGEAPQTPAAPIDLAVPPPQVAPTATPSPEPLAPQSISKIVARVTKLSSEEQVARAAELASIPRRTADQESEYELLKATVPAPQESAPETPLAAAAAAVEAAPPRAPDSDFQYTVQRDQAHPLTGETIPGYTQIDPVVNGGRGEPLTDEQRAALPQAPDWLPTGQYSIDRVKAALEQGPPQATQAAPTAPTVQYPENYRAPRPLAESLGTVQDALAYRDERMANYRNVVQEQIGINPEQTDRLVGLLAREQDTSRFEKTLTPEQQTKLESFFDGPLNQRDGPLDDWVQGADPNLPRALAESNSKNQLADSIVRDLGTISGAPEFAPSDRFLNPVIALNRLSDIGGTWRDVMTALERKTGRMKAGDDSAELQVGYGKTIKQFADRYGISLPLEGQKSTGGVERAIAEAPKPSEIPALVPSTQEASIQPGTPQAAAVALQSGAARALDYGAVIQGAPSVDFQQFDPSIQPSAAQWEASLRSNLQQGQRNDRAGNRALTRVAVALQRPDSDEVVLAGLTTPQRINKGSGGTEVQALALQRMGTGREQRSIQDGGDKPAILREVLEAGYKPLAVLHFEGDPTTIFERFANRDEFNAAWDASGRGATEGTPTAEQPTTSDANLPVSQITGLGRIENEITRIGQAWRDAEKAGDKNEVRRLMDRYGELSLKQEQALLANQTQTGDVSLDPRDHDIAQRILAERAAVRLPTEAARTQEFSAVVERLGNQGGKVDLFAREMYNQAARDQIEQRLKAAQQLALTSQSSAQRNQATRLAAILTDRLATVEQSQGVTFSPYHIAISMDDVQNASAGNLVTLLHEAAEQLTARLNPTMRGAVLRGVEDTIADLRQKAQRSAIETGVPQAVETGAADLLAETLAQRFTADGIPESPSLAQAIVRWIKDLYYRVSMAAQAAFGREPDPQLAVDWFENQLRRVVSGDYDYRIGRLLNPYLKQPAQENVRRFTSSGGTPGGVTDFFDPYVGKFRQPSVLTDSAEAYDWNVHFRTDNPGSELDIPETEARARQHAAAVNHVLDSMGKIFEESDTDLPWEQWWQLVGAGENPKTLLASVAASVPGAETAKIGGDRMTETMNGLAGLEARQLMENIQTTATGRLAESNDQIEAQSDAVIAAARRVNEIEADRRNSELAEGALKERAQLLVRRFIKDYSKGLSTADQHGALAEAVRQAEQLLESDPIPEHYQEVFQKIMDGDISLWGYAKEIAKLELPLSDMTPAEVRRAIRDNRESVPELAQLSKNKPLLVALSTLAVKNQALMDDIALGRDTSAARYAVIHQELDQIRQASDQQLSVMIAAMEERGKATTLRERIRDDYITRRRDLRTARGRVERAAARAGAIEEALPGLGRAVDEAQAEGAGAMSEWKPYEGATYKQMRQGENGAWSSVDRVLHFNPDGSAQDGASIRSGLFVNNDWLKQNAKRAGSELYEQVKRQTQELMLLDVQRSNPAAQAWKLTKMLAPLGDNAKRIGGNAAMRISQMLTGFESVRFSHGQDVDGNAHRWSKAWLDVQKSTGIKDDGLFQKQVYDPINYFLNVNPGFDEQAAIRQAIKQARARLTVPPAENFNAVFSELLRQTKSNTEHLAGLANQYGAFVRDPRLKSQLRRAVAQGWLTNMRQVDGGLVRRIISDMQKAGWQLGFKDVETRGRKRQQVSGATTFQDLTAADTTQQATDQLGGAVQRLFTPGIIRDWLEPFINKGGTEVFSWEGNAIPQMDLQDAWQNAGGNILRWIDGLAGKVDLGAPADGEAEPLARFRLSMLQQLDGIFGMEAKHAYEWSQTRDLFDPLGPKAHVMMDARLNDQIPPEHLSFARYDPHTAQMLLSEIAFHSKFGRNGEAMVQALAELSDAQTEKRAAYEGLRGTTQAARELEAKALGYDYKDLRTAASRAKDVETLKNGIEQLMAVGRPGGPFDQSRAGMALQSFMVGQIVDNPKTGLYNWLSNFERPFAQRSLGPAAIRNSVRATGESIKGALGGLFEALNLHILNSSEQYKETTNALGGSRNLPWSQAIADAGSGNPQTLTDRVLVKPLSFMRYVQHKGVGSPAEAKEFPRMTPIPGLGVGNYMGMLAGAGGVSAELKQAEQMISNGIRYFAGNKEAASDPNFRFKAADLGLGRLDQGLFDWWRANTVEYGMGNLEDIVRGAMPAQAAGERLLTKDQVLRIAQMSMTEFDGQSSVNTTPSLMIDNPVLRRMLPLLRWPFWKMNYVHKTLRSISGQQDYAAMARGLGTLALWNLPVGLAFTFLLDKYDEDLLGKKSNLPSSSAWAGVPLVGPIADLLSSDKSIPDTLKAYLVRSARAGNTYGMASDLLGQIASPTDAASGRRIFSMDQRILAMSQFLNFQQAMENFAHQDWTTTWASVWSPLLRSMGGNGALHGLDIVNKALGLDNAESRNVMRINAANWLRAAASETDVPLRGDGGSGDPTAMSAWTREMYTSSMANDRIGFMHAYQRALDAARATVADDANVKPENREHEAETRVLSGWRGRDPMTIFAQRPTSIEMAKMFGAMDDNGKQDVQDALHRYQQFTQLIKPSPVETQMRTSINRMTNPSQFRIVPKNPVGSLF